MSAEILISVSVPCAGIDLFGFLRHARGGPRFLWQTNREPVAFAGAGIAADVSAWGANRFAHIERKARQLFDGAIVDTPSEHATPRLFGGFAFRDDFVPDFAWSEFAPAQFLLPHFQLTQVGEQRWLTINSQVQPGDDTAVAITELRAALNAKLEAFRAPVPPANEPNALGPLTHLTTPADWSKSVITVTDAVRAGRIRKVVLSRAAEARFDGAIDVEEVLANLRTAHPDAYTFLFEPRAGQAFFGATPELLGRVQGRMVETMALAGSMRRGRDAAEDAQLADALLNSDKDRGEHQIVADEIVARLRPISKRVEVGRTGIVKLSNIQHVHTPICAELRRATSAIKLAQRLHPTPALGGEPRDLAMTMIGDLEPVTRGWYGAPIGWLDQNLDGAFVVAIRSAVAQDERAWLYAGAGIVGASVPEREWDETALKFRAIAGALKVNVDGEIHHRAH